MAMPNVSRRLLLLSAIVLAAAVATPARALPPGCTASDPDTCADDFNCYQVWVTENTPKLTPVPGVTLVDQFETASATVIKPTELCAPANKNAEGVHDPVTHLVRYRIKQSERHVQRTAVRVTNQLEEIRVDTLKPSMLLVPTNKTLTFPGPPAPNPTGHDVDHYKCYRVRVTTDTPVPARDRKVTVEDQFTAPPKILTLRKPRHLCTPVNKNGEGIENDAVHLLCYAAKPARGEPKHLRREGTFINNQFGPLRLDTLKEREFCIPTLKSLSPSGAFLDGGEGLFD